MIPGIVAGYPVEGGGGATPFWAVASYAIDGSVAAANRLGWVFTVTGGDLICNTLRVISPNTGVTLRPIIHRNSDNVVIAQADILIGAANTWVESSVSEFTLLNGVAYTISDRRTDGSRAVRINNTLSMAGVVTGISTVSGSNNDSRPTSAYGHTYRGCDFGFVAP